ncbi:hypothetical protein BDR26DRAFT_861501 [Obelidium mucronatum]|nr:hypothetical protein BDR26DRAFT_861501 [Obelidium mucronatum]
MQKTAILALAFSVLVQAQNRCGVSWEAANAACGASCVYPDAPCPAGQKCFADLNQAVCSGVVRTTAAAAATTDAAASAAGASATASALSPTDAVAVINQLPSCAVSCLANGSGSTVTLQTAQQLCASVASATTCLGTSCSKEQADASISFLTTNAGQLLNACKAIPAPTGASATAKASGTAAAAATTTTVAKVAEVKET